MDERDGINSAKDRIKVDKVDYLICWKTSRLSRRAYDIVETVRFLENNKTTFISIEDNIDTSTPLGSAFLIIGGVFAEIERKNIIAQVPSGMHQKARSGGWNGGIAPLGYNLIEQKLIVNPEEKVIVEEIFDLYLKNNGYKTIAQILKDKGLTTRANKFFSGNSIKEILRNPTYCGKIRWGKLENWNQKNEEKMRKRVYTEEIELYKGIHEAIISEDIFNAVQEKIENNPRSHVKPFRSNHILSGLLKCPECKGSMSIQKTTSKGKTYFYYQCNSYANKKDCAPNLISQNDIESEFFDVLDRIIYQDNFQNLLLTGLEKTNQNIESYNSIIKNKESSIKQLTNKNEKIANEIPETDDINLKQNLRKNYTKNNSMIDSISEEIHNLKKEILDLQNKNIDVTEASLMLKMRLSLLSIWIKMHKKS
jgi:site-specific DNA recombinase